MPVCSTNLGFSVENTNLGISVGYELCASYVCTWYQPADHSMVPGTCVQYRATSPPRKKNTWYQRALRCQLRGRPFHPWAGRLRFSGEAHPGPATLTQSSRFSCGAGLQSESQLLLCCAPVRRHMYTAVYMLLMLVYGSRCCVRFRALDQLLQPHQTVLRPHLPRARYVRSFFFIRAKRVSN